MKKIMALMILALGLATGLVFAQEPVTGWKLSPDQSKIAYGSIKKDVVGESNHFKTISGHVTPEGEVIIEIDVTSVETGIGVRNKRMIAHVFDKTKPTAFLKAKIDLPKLESLTPGATSLIDVDGTLTLSGVSIPVETSMFVARLSENKALVSTDEMIMLTTEDLGVDAGLDKLMELAHLPSITRAVPVTLRFVFEK